MQKNAKYLPVKISMFTVSLLKRLCFGSFCLFVCLLAGLPKKHQTDFDEIFTRCLLVFANVRSDLVWVLAGCGKHRHTGTT